MSPLSARFRRCAAAAAPAALLVACGTLAACSDDDRRLGPTAPGASPLMSATVSPAAVPGLAVVFLPPLQPARKAPFIGTFDASRSPAVEVCRWTGTQCDGAPIARFTRADGTGGTLLTVDAAQQLYQADWKAEGLTAGARYRIRVLLGGMELGHADAQVPGGGTSAGVILDAGLVPLGANRSLPIRFRLETSTSYLPGDPGAPASASIPRQDFVPRAADYSTGHPTLPGAVLSHNTVVLAPGSDATVGQINALLADLGAERVGGIPGAPGAAAGLLALRLPTATHTDLQAVLTRLRTDTRVATVVQDARVSGDALPAPATGLAADQHWTWDLGANDGNWGHELVRVPQLWNLNAGLKRVLEASQVLGPSVGVLDGGFVQGHPDLVFAANLDPERSSRHGSLVAGIVGATYDNGVGVDGVNPFARLVVGGVPMDSVNPTQTLQRSSSSMGLLWELYALVRSRPGIRVVNVSQGYNWYMMTPRISTGDTTVQRIATAQGAAAVEMLRSLQSANGQLPVIAASAGNGSAVGLGLQTARYSSPLANAAIVHGAAPVIVVEASTGTAAGALARAPFSNIGGHVSAPGTHILSTDSIPGRYAPCDGTSCAAPYVAGVASYLYALHPTLVVTLTSNPIRKLLVETGSPASGLPPHLDAFAAAMALDSEMGGSAVLRTLVDVDDGTLDGNTRTNADGSDYTADAHGDGRVDMRDFRRWRDWYLAAQKKPGVQLDGSPRHPKKDVNGNLRWDVDGDHENVFPRGDFNGNGTLGRTATYKVPGVMRNAEVTDLAVLQELFDDGNDGYRKEELPDLIESADVTVVASSCLASVGAANVRVRVYPSGGAVPPVGRTHDAGTPARVYTVKVADGAHTLRAEALDAAGQVIGSATTEIGQLPIGADVRWAAPCLIVTPASALVQAGATQQFSAAVPGQPTPSVTWRVAHGAITAAGLYTAPASGASVDTVTAVSVAEPGTAASVVVTVTPATGGSVVPLRQAIMLETGAAFAGSWYPSLDLRPAPVSTWRADDTQNERTKVRDLSWTDQTSLSGGFGAPPGSESPPWSAALGVSASLDLSYTLTPAGTLTAFSGRGSATGTATESTSESQSIAAQGLAYGNPNHNVYFRVVGGPVKFAVTFTCSATLSGGFSPSIGATLKLTTYGGSGQHAADYCNAWGRGSVTYTTSGVLAPGDYELFAYSRTTATASTGARDDLQNAATSYSFRLTFTP